MNVARDHWRNRRAQFWREMDSKGIDASLTGDYLASSEHSPEARVLLREQCAHLWSIVETLSPGERTIFLLRYVEELQLSEIGISTGLKPRTVKIYLAQALVKVRRALNDPEELQKGNAVESGGSVRTECLKGRNQTGQYSEAK